MSQESTGGRSTPGAAGSGFDVRESEKRTLARAAFTLCQLGAELQELAEAMSGGLGEVHYAGDVALPVEVCARQGIASGLAAAVTCGRCVAFLQAAAERSWATEDGLAFELRRAQARIERAAAAQGAKVETVILDDDNQAAELGARLLDRFARRLAVERGAWAVGPKGAQ